jgi:tetratricopeptide (TPR) repeat protein
VTLTLLPDLGDLLRLHPQLNAGTLVEVLRFLGEREVIWASGPDPDHPLRDALPAARIGVRELDGQAEGDTEAEHGQLTAFLSQYPQGRERLRNAARAEQTFAAVLTAPLTVQRALGTEVQQAARAYHAATRAALDEGPGTRWRARRLAGIMAALAGVTERVVLAPLDDLPDLLARLPAARLPDLAAFTPGETSRLRALADRAWQLREEDDLGELLAALDRESGDAVTPRAELDAAAASIHLAVGDLGSARTLLERAAHALQGDLPRSLPGLVLAWLGQVRDAQGDRELAGRTYRAVLALSHAPAVARGAAEAGLREAFRLEGG